MAAGRQTFWSTAAVVAAIAIPIGSARAADSSASGKLAIDHIDMKPTKDGSYDATVFLVETDQGLGKDKKVAFSIVVGGVQDADEAITKIHDPVRRLAQDLQQGYQDIHREP